MIGRTGLCDAVAGLLPGKEGIEVIQGAVPQEKKWLPEQLAPTKDLYLEQTRKHWDAEIVIWPEAAILGRREPHARQLRFRSWNSRSA